MASLYDLTQDVAYLQDLLESGDIDEQVYADSVESMCVDGKIENICKVVRNLEAKSAAYKTEVDRMNARKKAIDNSIKRLKDSMLNYMLVANEKKMEAGLFTVSVGASTSVNVWDKSRLPDEYLLPQDVKVDKIALSKALKDGEVIDGAELVQNPFLSMR